MFKLTQGFDWIKELQSLSPGDRTADYIVRGVILGLLVAGLLAVVALKVLLRWFREFRDSALALVLERRFPRELGDRLITAVEMADPKLASKYGFSQAMIDKTIQDAAERVEQVPVKQVFNWGRLGKLAGLVVALTVGMYVLVGTGYLGINALTGHSASPAEYFWRFHHTASIWTERNILLMNSYWPRQAYLKMVRFQDTDEHPGEMHIGRDESRPDLQVRAFQWVVADDAVADGWRPLTWRDLPTFVDPSLVSKVNIPADWGGWQMDLDDLDSKVPTGIVPATLQGKDQPAVRAELAKPDMRKAIASVGAEQLVADWLDWQTWTLDRVANQSNIDAVGRALRVNNPSAQGAGRRPRQGRGAGRLGDHGATAPQAGLARVRRRGCRQAHRLLLLGQEHQDQHRAGSIRRQQQLHLRPGRPEGVGPVHHSGPRLFHASAQHQAGAAPRHHRHQYRQRRAGVSLLPAARRSAAAQGQEADLQESPRVGDRRDQHRPGADRRQPDGHRRGRPPLEGQRAHDPPRSDRRARRCTPVQKVELGDDQKTFSTSFRNVVKTIEFNFEFMDRDNVGGKRRIVIRPVDDRAPEVFDVEMTAGLRKPLRADPGKSSQGAAADGFLITPDALVPFKGTLRDDYGLTQANWHYDVEPIEFELVSKGDKDKLPHWCCRATRRCAAMAW